MCWTVYDPDETEKKDDELSDEDLDAISGGGKQRPI
jgi:bacteriocin-like protein